MVDIISKIQGIVGPIFEILAGDRTKDSLKLKNVLGNLEIRNQGDTDYARVVAAEPVAYKDLVNNYHFLTKNGMIIVSGSYDGSGTPTNTTQVRVIILTNNGSPNLAFDNGTNVGNMVVVTPQDGQLIFIKTSISGTLLNFQSQSIYSYLGSAWVRVGGPELVPAIEVLAIPFTTTTADSIYTFPSDTIIHEIKLKITSMYTTGAGISVGTQTTSDLFIGEDENKPTKVALYQYPFYTDFITGEKIRVTITGSPTSGSGVCAIYYSTAIGA